DGNEDRMAHLAGHGFRQVAFAVGVFDQEHLARPDHALLAVARGDLDAGVEIDDVLPARRRMPVEIVVARGLAEDGAGRRKALRQLAARPVLDPFDLDVAEMGLAFGVDVEIVNTHGCSLIERAIVALRAAGRAGGGGELAPQKKSEIERGGYRLWGFAPPGLASGR